MKNLMIIFLCLTLVGCSSAQSQFKQQGFGDGVYLPKYPIIFVHGLGYSGDYWRESKTFKEFNNLGWDTGADLKPKLIDGEVVVSPTIVKPAHIYTLSFSSGELAIVQQGKELAAVIEKIKIFNRAEKVILIGHSMGGLAIREYLQSDYYKEDVGGFVSLGTPHRGSNFDVEKLALKIIPKTVRNLVWKVDTKSDAVRDLRPKSIYLEGGLEPDSPEEFKSKDINLNGAPEDEIDGLNNFSSRPLPQGIMYSIIIGSGCPLIASREQCSWSDGVVKINSQDLNQIPGVNVSGDVLYTDKDHFGEANDSWVLMKAMKPYLVQVQ